MARVVIDAHSASSALSAIRTSFRGGETEDLIISKGTSLEVHALDPTGLRLALEIPLHGSVAAIAAVKRPSGARLLVLTTSRKLLALAYDPTIPGSVRCESSVTVSELAGRLSDECQTILVDEENRCIVVHLYVGFVRIFPSYDKPRRGSGKAKSDQGSPDAIDLSRNYNIRLPDPNIKHLAFLPLGPSQMPTLGLLYLTHNGDKAFNTRCISLEDKELVSGPVSEILLNDAGSSIFIPFGAPDGDDVSALSKSGAAVVGEESVTVISLGQKVGSPGKGKGKAREAKATIITTIKLPIGEYRSFCRIDDERDAYLIGDLYGSLSTLRLKRSAGYVTSAEFSPIGQTSSAMALVYLANQFIFVASHYGDSQLCRLPADPGAMQLDDEGGPSEALDVVNTFTNLAPIVDFCVVDTEGYGQCHIVTCSGAYNDGSLRIVRHGVGLSELGVLDMERVQQMWPLQRSNHEGFDDLLMVSSADDTRLFLFGGEESAIEEIDSFEGFDLSRATLHACQFTLNGAPTFCQVTKSMVVIIGDSSVKWTSPGNEQLTLATSDEQYLLVAATGGHLQLLRGGLSLDELASTKASNEISCATLHAFAGGRKIAAVATWASHELIIYSLPDMQVLTQVSLDTTYLPRSILAVTFADGADQLFIGLGDGTLINFLLADEGGAKVLRQDSKKIVTLGQRPITLSTFQTEEGGTSVLACSDRPTVITRTSGRLSYASVNLRNINVATFFNSAAFPSCLVLASPVALRFGRIDEIRKLHIRTVTLGSEQPQRIVYSPSAKAYGVVCLREVLDRRTGNVDRQASFKVLDDSDFGILADFELDYPEQGLSLCVAPLGSDKEPESFIVGTGHIEPDSIDSKRGRIVAFSHSGEGMFTKAGEHDVDGAVYALARLPEGRLVAAVNSKVIALGWHGVVPPYASAGFVELAEWASFFLATTLSSRLDSSQVVVGDALRSVVLLQYDHESQQLIEVGREHSAYGITAVASLDVDTLIGAEEHFNLYTLQLGTEVHVHGGELPALLPMGMFHLGEFVTKFVSGSIVPTFAQSSAGAKPNLLYATSTGAIGVIADLDRDSARLLSNLQRNMRKTLPSLGDLDQQDWRTFRSANRVHDPAGFIDGGFISRFADLPSDQADAVLAGVSEHERILEDRTLVYRLVESLEQIR